MGMEEQLTEYYLSTYSYYELAGRLAQLAVSGEAELMPEQIDPNLVASAPGRPSTALLRARQERLIQILDKAYPVQLDLASLASTTGYSRSAITRLQKDPIFLTLLDDKVAAYFTSLAPVRRTRLPLPWRAALDLHNYRLLLLHPGRPPLYRLHALVWGRPPNLSPKALRARDDQERQRVMNPSFHALLREAGWPEPEQVEDRPQLNEVEHTCAFLNGYVDRADIGDIEVARGLIDPDQELSWHRRTRRNLEVTTSNDIIRQLMGLR
jgi:hypothetical protein